MKRRWMESALNETKKPLPKMPWQQRKVAQALVKRVDFGTVKAVATA
jgi:hypothetical protein